MPAGLLKSKTIVSGEYLDGITTSYEYNQYNQKTKVTDALGNEQSFIYDENRKLTKTIGPDGAVTEHIYDTARDIVSGAKIIQTIDPLGNSEHYEYDEIGNMIVKWDKKGNPTRYVYDGMNRLVREIDSFQNEAWFDYDGNGNIVVKWDKRQNEVGETYKTTFTYDAANRKTSVTDAEGQTTQYVTRLGKVTRRMHNKSFTVDNQITILGGRNIGNEYFDADPDFAFVDFDVVALGPVAS